MNRSGAKDAKGNSSSIIIQEFRGGSYRNGLYRFFTVSLPLSGFVRATVLVKPDLRF